MWTETRWQVRTKRDPDAPGWYSWVATTMDGLTIARGRAFGLMDCCRDAAQAAQRYFDQVQREKGNGDVST